MTLKGHNALWHANLAVLWPIVVGRGGRRVCIVSLLMVSALQRLNFCL